MKKIFLYVAASIMVVAQVQAKNVASVTIGTNVTEFSTLAAAVSYADSKGEGLIQFLDAYSKTAYPQAWVTPCTVKFPDELGYKDNTKSFYTFNAYNPNNGDMAIGEKKANGTLSSTTDIARFTAILKEVDPSFNSKGVDIPNFSMKQLDGYADWHADFEVYFDADASKEDYIIAGNYGEYGWITQDQEGNPLSADMQAFEPIRLMQTIDQNLKYWELLSSVRTFHCGIISLNDLKNSGKTYYVNLYLYEEDNEDVRILVNTTAYTFPTIPTTLMNIESQKSVVKRIVNGKLVIVKGGKMFSALGAEL